MKKLVIIIAFLLFFSTVQAQNNFVNVIGASKNISAEHSEATLFLDSIKNKRHLYGLGPIEHVKGEIIILNGKAYSIKVDATGQKTEVTTGFDRKATFLVSANVKKWKKIPLSQGFSTTKEFQTALAKIAFEQGIDTSKAFPFRLVGTLKNAPCHVMNMTKETGYNSEDLAKSKLKFSVPLDEKIEIIGFYSTKHQGIFTPSTAFVHLHFLSKNKDKGGHIDEFIADPNTLILYLPK
jgi:acetolactate decarboxylase